MKNSYLSIILLTVLLVSCYTPSPVEHLLSCKSPKTITLDKTSIDFKGEFSFKTSSDWKTNYYNDTFQSSIMTADTTKSLSKTFIFEAAMYTEALEFTSTFKNSLQAKTTADNLTLVDENYFKWNGSPAYYRLVKGMKNQRTYQELNIYLNFSKTTYLKAQTQVYGDKNAAERICSSLQLFNTLKIK